MHLPQTYCFSSKSVGFVISGVIAMPWDPLEANWDPSCLHLRGCLQRGSDNLLA